VVEAGRRLRLIQERLHAASFHGERAGRTAVLAGEEHVEGVARGLGASGEEEETKRSEPGEAAQGNRARHSLPSPVRTRNSVPRTPSTAAGVFTFMASGEALASFPETTASVPFCNELSKAP